MLDMKKLLTKLLKNQPRMVSQTYTVPALSAGTRGYWTIPITTPFPDGATVTNVFPTSGSVSGLTGLQLTPITVNVTASKLYVEYYSPAAIVGNTYIITFHIWYIIT